MATKRGLSEHDVLLARDNSVGPTTKVNEQNPASTDRPLQKKKVTPKGSNPRSLGNRRKMTPAQRAASRKSSGKSKAEVLKLMARRNRRSSSRRGTPRTKKST